MRWVVDGNNVFGSRPDGWWNDRPEAQRRLAQRVAEWCRSHDDEALLVFDAPLTDETARLAGGNLTIVESSRRGRDAADHEIVERLARWEADGETAGVRVITSDKGLRERIPPWASVWGVGRFRDLIGY